MSEFCHEVLLYDSDEAFLRATAGFVREGLERDEPTLVVLDQCKNDRLQAVLGGDADSVLFYDMTEVGRNPSHIIPAWQQFFDNHAHGEHPVRGIAEPISATLQPDELIECERHEALLNLAFDDRNFTLLCPYDTHALSPSVIDRALSCHEFVVRHGVTVSSGPFVGLGSVHQLLGDVLPNPPPDVRWWDFALGDLHAVRELVRSYAIASHVSGDRVDDLVVAINEVAANSIRHGGGQGSVAMWSLNDRILCEIRDTGHFANPLADRVRVSDATTNGRGLWIANRLCDLVQIRSDALGTCVRIHLRLR